MNIVLRGPISKSDHTPILVKTGPGVCEIILRNNKQKNSVTRPSKENVSTTDIISYD